MDNFCNRRLFSIPSKVEMAEDQEYLWHESSWLSTDSEKLNENIRVTRERVASFLKFVPVDLEITKTVFVFSTAVQIVDTEIR